MKKKRVNMISHPVYLTGLLVINETAIMHNTIRYLCSLIDYNKCVVCTENGHTAHGV